MGDLTLIVMPSEDFNSTFSLSTMTEQPLDSFKVENMTYYLEYQVAETLMEFITPILSFGGIIGNIITIIILVKSSLRKSTTCWYMTVMAILDIVTLLFQLIWLFIRPKIHPKYFSGWTCGLIFGVFFFAIHYNVFLLVAMTIERYIAVRFPIRAQKLLNKRRTVLIISGLGCVSLLVNAHHLATRMCARHPDTSEVICVADIGNETFTNLVWPWIDATLYCFVPLFFLIVFNILIVRQLRRASRRQREMVIRKNGGRFASNQAQVTLMLLLVSVSFVFLVTPIALIILIERYAWDRPTPHDKATHHLLRRLAGALMFTNHSLNFVLYCLSGRRFRTATKALFCCHKINGGRIEMTTIASKNIVSAKSIRTSSNIEGPDSISDEDAVSLPCELRNEPL